MRQVLVASVLFGSLVGGVLSGCGSGDSVSASASGSGSGSGSGSASASGTITGFGSLFVNGKRFETDDASVTVDGRPQPSCTVSRSNTCGLQEGMTVKVAGSFDGPSYRAITIVQEDVLEGPITSKSQETPTSGALTVLGQTVIVDETTRFDSGINLGVLNVGDLIEVNGFVKADGVIVATFIERKPGTGCGQDGCELKGFVTNHNHATMRFQIGGLTIVYDHDGIAPDTVIDDIPTPSGSNWNGLLVEVKGTRLEGTTLYAAKIERERDRLSDQEDIDELEIEGFVTHVGSLSGQTIEFTIGTTTVRTTADTEFRGGTIDEIVVGAKLSAEGRVTNGVLIAKHVKFHESVRLEGDASVIGNTLTLAGLPGVTVTVNSRTELRDGGDRLSINDLDGRHVRIRGRVAGSSSVIATRIQRRSPDSDIVLQGPVQAINGDDIVILGVTVDVGTIDRFESENGSSMSRSSFLAAVTVNSLVKVKGERRGTTVFWDEAELED
ncbi:MAG: DUF5666 domain-containing protein [Nitrospira sp.]|nr:DUF5666 domain-containing protein [Nitrospira sp.]MCP9461184.1 DUF5666 domain-containing protein [Nitrospira sp.]MCP9475434.1 DUF5666 domain-containing protein [Nitrospira sp.]